LARQHVLGPAEAFVLAVTWGRFVPGRVPDQVDVEVPVEVKLLLQDSTQARLDRV